MGCSQSGAGSKSKSSTAKPELHPWSVEGGSGSSTWENLPDDEEIQVFYEYAVRERRTGGSDAMDKHTSDAVGKRMALPVGKVRSMRPPVMGRMASRRPPRRQAFSRASRGLSNSSLGTDGDEHGQRGHFLTAERLVGIAEDLGFHDLGQDEIARIHSSLPTDQKGKVGKEQFAAAVKAGPVAPALRLMVQKLHKGFAYGFKTPKEYDFESPTSENYRMDARDFTEEFAHLRRGIDYSYHNNYTLERQRWQDEVIKGTVVRSSEQPAPWLVFTCGPMGVGKGFCMNWMSKHGFFPLENIVHVDPDSFKMMMPEWPKYVKQSGEEAGTLCHMESAFMMEIAQWAAMERRQNIWIDGSLRNAAFYAQVFEDIRARFPHYKISIMYIYADETVIRERIKLRAESTGRSVPENLIQASLGAMDKVLNKLTPLCDFVARINNSGEVPVLTAFETVDNKGSWSILKERFARKFDDVGEFPQFLAPLPLVSLQPKELALFNHIMRGGQDSVDHELELRLDSDLCPGLRSLKSSTLLKHRLKSDLRKIGQGNSGSALALAVSPMSRVTLSSHSRKLAGIPEDAELYFWVFPFSKERLEGADVPQEDRREPLLQLLFQGAFCYCSGDGTVLSVHATSHKREHMFVQFDSPQTLSRDVVEKMKKKGRFHQVAAPYLRQRGATKFCWVMPDEIFGRLNVGGRYGGFVYLIAGTSSGLLFPVLSA